MTWPGSEALGTVDVDRRLEEDGPHQPQGPEQRERVVARRLHLKQRKQVYVNEIKREFSLTLYVLTYQIFSLRIVVFLNVSCYERYITLYECTMSELSLIHTFEVTK